MRDILARLFIESFRDKDVIGNMSNEELRQCADSIKQEIYFRHTAKLCVPINALDFSTRVRRHLDANNVVTVQDIIALGPRRLAMCPGIGDKALFQVRRELEKFGVDLSKWDEKPEPTFDEASVQAGIVIAESNQANPT